MSGLWQAPHPHSVNQIILVVLVPVPTRHGNYSLLLYGVGPKFTRKNAARGHSKFDIVVTALGAESNGSVVLLNCH